MSSSNPPVPNVDTFNNLYWISTDIPITQEQADKRYLRFPVAQGKENLQAVDVNGTANFNGTAEFNDVVTFDSSANFNATATFNQLADFNNIANFDSSANFNATATFNQLADFNNIANFDSSANFNATATFNTNVKYVDNTIQNSAYTGAANLAGSYTEANITIDANGKITSISNGTSTIPQNLTVNRITTSVNPFPSVVATTGINNVYNTGGCYSFYTNSSTAYGSTGNYTPSSPLQIKFQSSNGSTISGWSGLGAVVIKLNCFFYSGANWGATSCFLTIFSNALDANFGGSFGSTTHNINNKINGDASFGLVPRQYWTYNQYFTGVDGSNGYLRGTNNGDGKYSIYVYFLSEHSNTIWEYDAQILSSSVANLSNIGVYII